MGEATGIEVAIECRAREEDTEKVHVPRGEAGL